jgi:hypothetical protein
MLSAGVGAPVRVDVNERPSNDFICSGGRAAHVCFLRGCVMLSVPGGARSFLRCPAVVVACSAMCGPARQRRARQRGLIGACLP